SKVCVKVADKAIASKDALTKMLTVAAEGVQLLKTYLNTKLDSLFEIVEETKDLGTRIWYKLRNGTEAELPKSDLTPEQATCSITGCFTGDTLIPTVSGFKRIDSIKEGDFVLSKDVNSGTIDYKKVKYVYIKSTYEFVHLKLDNEEIRTTANHLFFTDCGWWKAAENLKVGDKILNSKGELKTLIEKRVEMLNEPEKIYNLNVEDFHTYFVGANALLVHNSCGFSLDDLVRTTGKSFKTLINENLGKIVKINGKRISLPSVPHNNGTAGHWDTMVDKAIDLAQHSDAEEIWLNKGLSNVTDLNKIEPNRRPDLLVKRADGKIDQYEVPSKTDDVNALRARMEDNRRILGSLAGEADIIFIP
ncbi:MAG TPA: polymorphic toxin-type HINT domain-containing protein, partial [Pseudobacteroides sp.]|uniref:polymorphic toxin-type HINT domain-containing protein n=1 Tax=Pseudobacteroides sp. TaxID=1968840 RepID=UPI002F922B6C